MKTLLIVSTLTLSACGTLYAPNPMQEGNIAIIADAKGMQAFSDLTAGLINESKTSADIKSSYFQHRDLTTQADLQKATAPSFLDKLFNNK